MLTCGPQHWTHPPGRPRTTWVWTVESDLHCLWILGFQCLVTAQERGNEGSSWRQLCSGPDTQLTMIVWPLCCHCENLPGSFYECRNRWLPNLKSSLLACAKNSQLCMLLCVKINIKNFSLCIVLTTADQKSLKSWCYPQSRCLTVNGRGCRHKPVTHFWWSVKSCGFCAGHILPFPIYKPSRR